MDHLKTTIVALLAMAIGGLPIAGVAVWRRRKDLPLIAPMPRRIVPWRLVDIVCVLLLYLIFNIAIAGVIQPNSTGPAETARSGLAIHILGNLLTLGTVIAYLRCLGGATWRDLGIDFSHLWADMRLGAVSFLLIAPVVYGLQALLVQWFPSNHPLIDVVQKNFTWDTLMLAIASAVISAPLFEEFVFRVLLQSWLEKEIGTASVKLVPIEHVNPSVTAGLSPETATIDTQNDELLPRRSLSAILIVSGIFAALHVGHGPDPIPLFVLSVALGYLYRQTHRLIPSLVVHLLLNSWTMTVVCIEWLQAHPGQ